MYGGSKFRGQLFQLTDFDETLARGMSFFDAQEEWRPQIDPQDRFLMGGHG